MNRVIKFRGRTISGKWVYGNLSVLPKNVRNVDAGSYISNRGGMPFAYDVGSKTVGQYIGYSDLNDVDIYDGDILRDEYDRTLLVVWRSGGFCFKALSETNFKYAHDISQWFDSDCQLLIIIGNIYDEKELEAVDD